MAKILIVDDRPTNRLYLVTLLKCMSHQLLEAADGKEALALTRAHRPDLVISDILMPVMDGFEFVRTLRADPAIAATPVIFYTSTYRAPEALALAERCGVKTVLRKPSDPEVILAAVERELGAKSSSPAASSASAYEKFDGGIPNWSGRGVAARVRLREAATGLGAHAIDLHRLNSNLTLIVELMLEATPEKGPEHVVQLFFHAAHSMIASEYAALFIPAEADAVQHLHTKGLDAAIYAGPHHGALAESLLKEWGVIHLPTDGTPAAVDLAPGHPAVRNLLGASIASKDHIYGWIILANKAAGDYSLEDERMLATLATELAVFYEAAAVHDTLQRHAAKLQLEVVRRQEAETATRAQEQKLAQAQKMETVGQLTGGLAHDFNNLLTVIKGASEDLQEEMMGVPHLIAPHLASQVKMIQQATQRGVDLVRQLMAFSRKQELNPAAVDLNALLEATASLLRRAVPETIAIDLKKSVDLPLVFVDAGTLENVVLNLAVNARDAMPDSGTLTIATSAAVLDQAYAAENPDVAPGVYVLLAVSDTGVGMPAAVIARAFEPFFTTKESGKGTGLGLSMVYGFVKQSGGHVRIYSEAGHGTTIKIYLPPVAGAVIKAAAPAAPAANRRQAAAVRILLVEDDDLVRSSVEIKLLRLGHTVTPVSNPGDALTALEGGAGFDLIFTDIIMPGPMTGADLARVVMERWPAIKILATSGYTESTLRGKITVPEGVRLLSKPYANTDLIAAIQAVLGGD